MAYLIEKKSLICKCCVLIIICFAPFLPTCKAAKKSDANSLENKLPAKVNTLFEWPSDDVISSDKRLVGNETKHVVRARRNSIQWIRKIIKKQWRPEDPNYIRENLIMIKDANGLIDAVYLKWQINDHYVQVGQSKTVITIRIVPVKTQTPRTTKDDRKQHAKELCLNIVNRLVDIRVTKPATSHFITKDITTILLNSSFDRAKITQLSDATHGTLAKIRDRNDSRNANYWWGRFSWWVNDNVTGFYTLKTEGGAWKAGYNSKIDNSWF